MTILHANNKYFVATHDSMQEIDYSTVLQWQLEGMEMLIESGENHD